LVLAYLVLRAVPRAIFDPKVSVWQAMILGIVMCALIWTLG